MPISPMVRKITPSRALEILRSIPPGISLEGSL